MSWISDFLTDFCDFFSWCTRFLCVADLFSRPKIKEKKQFGYGETSIAMPVIMNQRVRIGLVIIILLLAVLLCLYFEIPTHIIAKRFETPGDEELPDPHETSPGQSLENLPQSVIDGVKTFVFFLGHPHSGHSIVASLLDSHPHMVISHEADLFTKLSRGSLAPTKSEVFNAIWNNTKTTIVDGKRAGSTLKGYTLLVDDLYQGKYEDYIDVIGDKKAGSTTMMLQRQPDKWSNVFNNLKSLIGTMTLKVIHVIRNPYDNIATNLMYSFNTKIEFRDAKQSNETFEVDADRIERKIENYFLCHQAIMDAEKTYNLDIIKIHGKDLISDPRGTLMKMCNYLEVTCSNNYLEICSNVVFKTESRTRYLIKWTDEQLKMIQQNIEKFTSLKGYSFGSM